MIELKFHSDAGHGWLEAPKAFVSAMGVKDKISGYSYQDANNYYLEEDSDASLFINALKEQSIQYKIIRMKQENRSFIRSL